jgi:hypothetical protein
VAWFGLNVPVMSQSLLGAMKKTWDFVGEWSEKGERYI